MPNTEQLKASWAIVHPPAFFNLVNSLTPSRPSPVSMIARMFRAIGLADARRQYVDARLIDTFSDVGANAQKTVFRSHLKTAGRQVDPSACDRIAVLRLNDPVSALILQAAPSAAVKGFGIC